MKRKRQVGFRWIGNYFTYCNERDEISVIRRIRARKSYAEAYTFGPGEVVTPQKIRRIPKDAWGLWLIATCTYLQ